ncbi:hypothetical protein AAC387_Pa04g2402 [Persea americana]
MESLVLENPTRPKWKKVAYGGMQPGYDDNYTDESFLEEMVMNANVVKRDLSKVMRDAVSISQYLCIVALVGCVWTYTLESVVDETSLLFLDMGLLVLGFLVLLLTSQRLSLQTPWGPEQSDSNKQHLFECIHSGLSSHRFSPPIKASCVRHHALLLAVVCPYWLIKMQEYKFEINGPWDEAKLCFDITE